MCNNEAVVWFGKMPPNPAGLTYAFPATHKLYECIHHFIEGKRRIMDAANLSFGN